MDGTGLQPMVLRPSGKDYLWGGEKLKSEYGKAIDINPLAETWECSVHPDGPSFVESGAYRGLELRKVLTTHPEFIGTKVGDRFPILIKFIDAKKDLSVQVHPDDEYARIHENDIGKTEMWHVLEAEEGASLICGFQHNVTVEQLRYGIIYGNLDKNLQRVLVHKGDTFFIPPGTVHAIGAGIVLAEIQESSNVTYRLYDYNRVDPKTGEKRELHFDKAIQVLNMNSGTDVRQKPRKVSYYPGCSREILCRCRYFETENIVVSMGFSFSVHQTSFQVLLITSGEGGISTECSKPLRFRKGDCIFIPAGTGRCHVIGRCEMLKVRC